VSTDTPSGRLGPYHLNRIIGEGGQSVVWLATDVRTNRTIALKVLRAGLTTPNDIARLRREARVMAAIPDPGLPKGIELFENQASGTLALAMEFVDGTPLARVTGPLPPAEVVAFAKELVRILGVVHGTGIVHRDLKPANIILRGGWGSFQPGAVVLVDFGIAKGSDSNATKHTATGAAIGTIAFMAPELLLGNAPGVPSPTWDIYSAGIILWALLTGTHPSGLPFTAPLSQFVMAHAQKTRPVLDPSTCARIDSHAPGLVAIVQRCIAADPKDRFQSTSELGRAMSQVAAQPLTPTAGIQASTAAHPPTAPAPFGVAWTNWQPGGSAQSQGDCTALATGPGGQTGVVAANARPYGGDYTRLPTALHSGSDPSRSAPTALVHSAQPSGTRSSRKLLPLVLVLAGLAALAVIVVVSAVGIAGFMAVRSSSAGSPVHTSTAPAAADPTPTSTPRGTPTPTPVPVPVPASTRKTFYDGMRLEPNDEFDFRLSGGEVYINPSAQSAGSRFNFPDDRNDSLCIRVRRTGEWCCMAGRSGKCVLRVRAADLFASGEGLTIELRSASLLQPPACTMAQVRTTWSSITYRSTGYFLNVGQQANQAQCAFGVRGLFDRIGFFLDPSVD